jgi:hypothetical protein
MLSDSICVHAEDSKSAAPQGDWIADAKTGCKVWNPAPAQDCSAKTKEGDIYIGGMKDNLPHGKRLFLQCGRKGMSATF